MFLIWNSSTKVADLPTDAGRDCIFCLKVSSAGSPETAMLALANAVGGYSVLVSNRQSSLMSRDARLATLFMANDDLGHIFGFVMGFYGSSV